MKNNVNNNIDFIEFNLKRGRKTFSFKELAVFKEGNVNSAKQYIKYYTGKSVIKNLSKGFYAVYSPTEKDSGVISPGDFIDQLMSYKRINYYTGLLSAASFFGATHYRPIVYQVVVNKQVHTPENILNGLSFHRKKCFPDNCIIKQKGNYGYINYSSPALTAYDLIKYEKESGTISNIIPVISELIQHLKSSDIKYLLKNDLEVTYIQRFGLILEKLGAFKLIKPLYEYSKRAAVFTPLSRLGNKTGNKNFKWKIIENVNTEEFYVT
jgi:predicted transcriptional regulator of viral defense system